jgi:phosphatidylglycerophosphate synthase
MADVLTLTRLALAPLIVWCGLAGRDEAAAVALVAGGVSDWLDGVLARRRGPSRRGAHLDAVADTCLLAATAAALYLLHPEIVATLGGPLAVAGTLYLASCASSWLAFRRLVDPRQRSAKAAGGILYLFALVTLVTGSYVPALLVLALLVLALSSVETILAAARTIHNRATPSSARSQAPHAEKGVASRTPAAPRSVTSATPSASESRP